MQIIAFCADIYNTYFCVWSRFLQYFFVCLEQVFTRLWSESRGRAGAIAAMPSGRAFTADEIAAKVMKLIAGNQNL